MGVYIGSAYRVMFHDKDTGFTIFRIETEGGDDVCIKGVTHNLHMGVKYECVGEEKKDKFGPYVYATSILESRHETEADILAFLTSGIIEGIGEVNGKAIVKRFGMEAMDVIYKTPFRLEEIKGIGKAKRRKISNSAKQHIAIKDILAFLKMHHISNNEAFKIYKIWEDKSIEKIKSNPYLLTTVQGIGFTKADAVAKSLGYEADHPNRIMAGVYFALDKIAEEGHTATYLDNLINTGIKLLSVPEDKFRHYIELLVSKAELMMYSVGESDYISHPKYYWAEADIAKRILDLINTKSPFAGCDFTLEAGFPFTESQINAIHTAVNHKFSVITGGPGVGKTTVTKAVISAFEEIAGSKGINIDVAVCAPTGRAAKKANEATGKQAVTVHRLLGRGEDEDAVKLDFDLIIVDETSMLDVLLTSKLLKAIRDDAVVIFIGDVDQLASVQAGNVLDDLMSSGVVPVARLTENNRVSKGSLIDKNAYLINDGKVPKVFNKSGDDFFFLKCARDQITGTIVDLMTKRIPDHYGYSVDDIQVLSPKNVGSSGCVEINSAIQERYNPKTPQKEGVQFNKNTYRVGDRVMQVKNDYDYEVFNGDIGKIVDFPKDGGVIVEFDEGCVEFSSREALCNLKLSYACTIHKSQGSEFPVVIIPCSMAHNIMLMRSIIYTGVTRARKLVIMVGELQALSTAVSQNRKVERITLLKIFLDSGNIPARKSKTNKSKVKQVYEKIVDGLSMRLL